MNIVRVAALPAVAIAAWGASSVGSTETHCGLPVGSVIAYAGSSPPAHWEIADGRPLDRGAFRELYDAIGTAHGAGYRGNDKVQDFNLPDYRGRFLRGVDSSSTGGPSGRDPGERRPSNPGGNPSRGVGSIQDDATRLPNTPFRTGNDAPDHTHAFRDAYFAEWGGCCSIGAEHTDGNNTQRHEDDDRTRGANQRHQHVVTGGGDSETRPKNAAVYWIICKE